VRRLRLAAPLCVGAVLLLAGCAAPDPQLARDEARAVFDDLVALTAAEDATVVRALRTADPAEQTCEGAGADEDERTQTALTATATLSITTTDADTRRIRDDLLDTLDPEEWTAIHSSGPEQVARISDRDVVVALTAEGPALVIAVFTPCIAP
jgi:hypothetical protein